MIELVFSACLIAQPATCKDVHLTFEETRVSLIACALYGQFEMARWVNEHPRWRPGRFRCAPARASGTDI
jgi:hypothetical protein